MKNIALCCPCKNKEELSKITNGFVCANTCCIHSKPENAFPIVNNIPILISETRTDTVCTTELGKTYVERPLAGLSTLKKALVGESSATKQNCDNFVKLVSHATENPRVLVIGGAEKGSGLPRSGVLKTLKLSLLIYTQQIQQTLYVMPTICLFNRTLLMAFGYKLS